MMVVGKGKATIALCALFIYPYFLLFLGCGDNAYVSNVSNDPSLEQYLCTENIATTPGFLALLPIGSAGIHQTRAYAEYVPPSYGNYHSFPCIINLHGDGELGDGKTESVLEPFAYSCLTGMIKQDTWDKKYRFVVLSPQFSSYSDRSAVNVNEFIQYAKANYKIDINRIYLTAVSGGGVALGNYLTHYSGGEAAAVLPVSCYVPPISSSAKWKNVPAWFLCGASDTVVGTSNVIQNYRNLVKASAPFPPLMTLYTGVGHDANSVNKTYNPESMDNAFEAECSGVGLVPYSNIYDWLLKYHR
jgi:predicted peptidase